MASPLKKLQMAERRLSKLNEKPKASVRSFSAGGQLKRLESITGTTDFQTFNIVGSTIPKRWCPEVVPKVNTVAEVEQIVNEVLEDTQAADIRAVVYDIFSDPAEPGLLVVSGGTP